MRRILLILAGLLLALWLLSAILFIRSRFHADEVSFAHGGTRITLGCSQKEGLALAAESMVSDEQPLRWITSAPEAAVFTMLLNATRTELMNRAGTINAKIDWRLAGLRFYRDRRYLHVTDADGESTMELPYFILFASWAAMLSYPLILPLPYFTLVLHRWRRQRSRARRGLCANCGYDLRASKSRCPECGAGAEAVSG